MPFFRKSVAFHLLWLSALQALVAFALPLTPLAGEQHQVPTDFTQCTNPASQSVIIDLDAPPPQPEPVPPPVKTPQPMESEYPQPESI
jgi:hypothetical protein